MKKIASIILASVALFATSAKAEYKFNFVMHSDTNNAFWAAVHKGFKDACAQINADCQMLTLSGDGDQQEQLQNLESSIAQGVDGIVTTITNPTIFDAAVDEALAAGIPVISMNSGSDDFASLGISAHVGQTEFEAGVGGGQKMKAAGGKKALCVNHEVGNVALDRRCAGFKKGFGGSVDILGTSNDPTEIQKAVAAKLGGGYDTILTLGAGLAGEAALKALESAGKVGSVKLGTFDMSPGMLKAAAAGKVEFLIDQQQYLQGYLPIAIFSQYMRYGTMPAGVVMTGPGFVTPNNAKDVIKWAAQGYR